MKKLRVGVLASGRGSNLQAIMEACERGEIQAEVVVVVSDIAGAQALNRAQEKDIPAVHVDPSAYHNREEYELRITENLKEHRVDLVCLAGYMRLVGKVLLENFLNQIINIHPSLLPSFKGLNAQQQAFEYGVKYSGCTVHFVDSEMDTGPIILQEIVPVYQEDNEVNLSARILEKEHIVYAKAINLFAKGLLRVEGRKVMILQA